jgi:hypothetical protein
VNNKIILINMSICASYPRPYSNVRREVVIQAIDCKGNNRSTVGTDTQRARLVDQEEKKAETRKLASILSISPIDHRHRARWS